MKKLLLLPVLTLFVITVQSCAIVTSDSKPVEKVVTVENSTKNELYVRAHNWMVSAFNNAESVIQFTDKETGTITGKYLLGTITQSSQYGPANRAYAIIQIKVKDGASKITITPDAFKYAKGNPYTLYTGEQAVKDIDDLIASFENEIVKKEDNNW